MQFNLGAAKEETVIIYLFIYLLLPNPMLVLYLGYVDIALFVYFLQLFPV